MELMQANRKFMAVLLDTLQAAICNNDEDAYVEEVKFSEHFQAWQGVITLPNNNCRIIVGNTVPHAVRVP